MGNDGVVGQRGTGEGLMEEGEIYPTDQEVGRAHVVSPTEGRPRGASPVGPPRQMRPGHHLI